MLQQRCNWNDQNRDPRMVQEVADRAMQVHGGMGICQDTRYRNLDLRPACALCRWTG